MNLRTYRPGKPLADFVDLFWVADKYAASHAKERVLPGGTVELVIHLGAGRSRGPLVAGPQSRYFIIDTARPASILGVHFKPGGAFPFLGIPAGELHNQHVCLEALWGARAGELGERALEARSDLARVRLLERTLLERGAGRMERHPAVALALGHFRRVPPTQSIGALTERLGLSPRRFIELFEREVGLTPKLFGRISRFQQVLKLIHRCRDIDWPRVALACGYYDQAHFIHDFRAFSGFNPTAFAEHQGDHLNHVPHVA